MRTAAILSAALLLLASAYASAKSFETKCGDSRFRVTVENRGHPLDNVYSLFGTSSGGEKRLFIAEDGGWLHAACVTDAKGKSLLLFQSYCGGSACVEDKYGIVEPRGLKLLLTPSAKNIGNSKAASNLLGKPAPYLPRYEGAFCCEK
jgi:hypothetical protein